MVSGDAASRFVTMAPSPKSWFLFPRVVVCVVANEVLFIDEHTKIFHVKVVAFDIVVGSRFLRRCCWRAALHLDVTAGGNQVDGDAVGRRATKHATAVTGVVRVSGLAGDVAEAGIAFALVQFVVWH